MPHTPPDWRVSPLNDAIVREAAEGLCKHFHVEPDAEDREEAIAAISEALRSEDDGYIMAKVLDRDYGWEIGEDDVEALSSARSNMHSLANKKTNQIIRELGLKPKFAVGDTVTWRSDWHTQYTGVIKSVLAVEMKYHVPILPPGADRPIEYIVEEERLTKVTQ